MAYQQESILLQNYFKMMHSQNIKVSCKDYLKEALEALQKAQNHQDWDKYSIKTYYAVDLNLEDALTVLQAAIAED